MRGSDVPLHRLEEEDKPMNAEGYYSKALTIDNTFTDAEEALNKVRQCIQKSLDKREKSDEKEEKAKEKKIETSAEKLRKLLKEEKRYRYLNLVRRVQAKVCL
ncbi:hypothetical protein AB205_0096740 [Aquarana catesbeiana]|uniref:Uncharacterized protein n=1 Tax=Aquarana catesbeiana TaxID=8400 RepID=A0A2G9RVB2_AQUCT|nr:hypothetical protein AB205_0096740 [Aquarana catesbeiana]